jgi:hypothetical protein
MTTPDEAFLELLITAPGCLSIGFEKKIQFQQPNRRISPSVKMALFGSSSSSSTPSEPGINPNMSSGEIKDALIRQMQSEQAMTNARILIQVLTSLFSTSSFPFIPPVLLILSNILGYNQKLL